MLVTIEAYFPLRPRLLRRSLSPPLVPPSGRQSAILRRQLANRFSHMSTTRAALTTALLALRLGRNNPDGLNRRAGNGADVHGDYSVALATTGRRIYQVRVGLDYLS